MRNLSLRWRLLIFFMIIALLPVSLLMVYTARLLEESIDIGLNERVEGSLEDGLSLAR